MRSYVALGRYAEAKATFLLLEQVLYRLLQVPPSKASKTLAARLPAA
jgi:hypothetical protein